jgi:hypothetical protein
MALVAIVPTCLFWLGQPAVAQSKCLQAKATFVDVCLGGPTCTGTITQGGILNGTTLTLFTGGPSLTPDPNTFSFTNDLTITTVQGQLKIRIVNLFNVATGVTSGFGNIDPNTSTGRFAGATGLLFVSGKAVGNNPFTVKFDISGEICLAN